MSLACRESPVAMGTNHWTELAGAKSTQHWVNVATFRVPSCRESPVAMGTNHWTELAGARWRKKHSTLGQRCHFPCSIWIQALASCSLSTSCTGIVMSCFETWIETSHWKSMPKPPEDVESNMSQRSWRRSSQSSSLSSARTSSISSSSSTQQRIWHNRAKLWKHALPIAK